MAGKPILLSINHDFPSLTRSFSHADLLFNTQICIDIFVRYLILHKIGCEQTKQNGIKEREKKNERIFSLRSAEMLSDLHV